MVLLNTFPRILELLKMLFYKASEVIFLIDYAKRILDLYPFFFFFFFVCFDMTSIECQTTRTIHHKTICMWSIFF